MFKEMFTNESYKDTIKNLNQYNSSGIEYKWVKNNGNTSGAEVIFEINDIQDVQLSLSFFDKKAQFRLYNKFKIVPPEVKKIFGGNLIDLTTEEGLKIIKNHFDKPDLAFGDLLSNTGNPLSMTLLELLMKKYAKPNFTKVSKGLFKMNDRVEMIAYLLKKVDFQVDEKTLKSKDLGLRVGVSQGKQSLRIDDTSKYQDVINVIGSKLDLFEIQGGYTSFKMNDKELKQVAELLPKKLVIKYSEFLNYKMPDDWVNPLSVTSTSSYTRKNGADYSGHKFGNSIGGDSSNYRD